MLKRNVLITVAIFFILLILIVLLGSNLTLQVKQVAILRQGVAFDVQSENYPELEALKSVLDTKQVFLFGETHASKTNYDLQLRYLKYLAQNNNVKYILLEVGYSTSQLLNKYLENGDDALLKQLFSNYSGTFLYTSEAQNFIYEIKKYNETVSSDNKLIFIGIDTEQQPSSITLYMKSLFRKDVPVPQDIENYITAINDNQPICYSFEFLQSLYSSLFTQKPEFSDYLGDNYKDFFFLVSNTLEYMQDREVYTREQLLAQNFKDVYEHYPKASYFAQFGLLHVLREPLPDGKLSFLTEIVNSIPQLSDKIFTCTYRYADSYFYHPLNGSTAIADFEWPVLYNPPFDTVLFLPPATISVKNIMQEARVPDRYGDCIILIRNSPAASYLLPKPTNS